MFDIGRAVKEMWNGACVARSGWNGKGMYVEMQKPDEHSKMTRPYVWAYSTSHTQIQDIG